MRDSPTRGDMMNPAEAQSGTPNYIDKSAESVDNTFYPKRGQDAPAYKFSNPRYWEYR